MPGGCCLLYRLEFCEDFSIRPMKIYFTRSRWGWNICSLASLTSALPFLPTRVPYIIRSFSLLQPRLMYFQLTSEQGSTVPVNQAHTESSWPISVGFYSHNTAKIDASQYLLFVGWCARLIQPHVFLTISNARCCSLQWSTRIVSFSSSPYKY